MNFLPWPSNFGLDGRPDLPPPVGTRVNCSVVDLSSMEIVGKCSLERENNNLSNKEKIMMLLVYTPSKSLKPLYELEN